MIEHKYLKLFYRFCKENNLIKFLPKTFDEDLKAIKNKKPFIIISNNAYKNINNNKKKLMKSQYVLYEMNTYDVDIYWDSRNETEKKHAFFPESLICLLRRKSRYTNDTLFDFCTFYHEWKRLIKNEIKDDFFDFMNSSVLTTTIKPYKFSILKYVENESFNCAKQIVPLTFEHLKPLINKEYNNDEWDIIYMNYCFSLLHVQWYNFLLNKL